MVTAKTQTYVQSIPRQDNPADEHSDMVVPPPNLPPRTSTPVSEIEVQSSLDVSMPVDDSDYQPSFDVDVTNTTASMDDGSFDEEMTEEAGCKSNKSPVEQAKYIVFEDNLDQLFHHCRRCGELVTSTKKVSKGSLLTVTTTCMAGHSVRWTSQPTTGRGNSTMGFGSWLIASAILLSGGMFSTFSLFAALLNLRFIGERSFFYVQKHLMCPVIHHAWLQHVTALKGCLVDEPLSISGDARCDSPGYSAKYGMYTLPIPVLQFDDIAMQMNVTVFYLGVACGISEL